VTGAVPAVESAEMHAVLVERPGAARLQRLPRPEPGPGEVLVRVGAAGICGSDVEVLEGRRPAPYVRYPIIPGHEWAGTVEGVGPGVENVEPGAPVVAEGFRSCGDCARCREGRTNLCEADYAETGFTHAGGFAEFLCVPAHLVHRLPPGTDLTAAALLEPAACVAQGLLEVDLRPGLSVAVVGAGTIGLLAVALLRLSSPSRLALVGTRPDRLALGRELGAGDTCDLRDENPVETLGNEFDLVFEAASRPEGAATAVALARRGGTVVLEGISGANRATIDPDVIVLGHLRIQGVFGASRAAWRWVVDLFASGELDPSPLVTHRFALDDFETAFAVLQDREAEALKVELVPGDAP
jgi:2-desacetyl-2-hydroxyethyl bacteriochlorophyllide A dehydrogenase